MTKRLCALPKNAAQGNLRQAVVGSTLATLEDFMRRDTKGPLICCSKVAGVAVAAGVGSLLHAITFAQVRLSLGQATTP